LLATLVRAETAVPVKAETIVSRPVTAEVVLRVTGPVAGAVQEYQREAVPGLARVPVAAGSFG
jgi:hypothetical protein